jgi:hypothetical protein
MTCPREAHVHHVAVLGLDLGYIVVDHSRAFSAQIERKDHAYRVAELINRHGLVDVPDDASALCPWPPPRVRTHTNRDEMARLVRQLGLPADPTKENHT